MKKLGKIMSLALAILLMASVALPVCAFAEGYSVNGEADVAVFNKYLTMDENASVPPVTVTFEIVPGEAADGVYAGVGTPTVGTATFGSESATTPGLPTDEAGSATSGKKYATQEVAIDFSGVTFTEPGIYRYVLTEASVDNDAVSKDTTSRTVDVYVIDTDGVLSVASYVIYNGNVDEGKNDGFTNSFDSASLEFGKTVTGNQGSRDKYFQFTVKVTTELPADMTFAVSGNYDKNPTANAATIYTDMSSNNVTELTGAQLNAGYTFYLHNGQNVKIDGLPKGVAYEVTEAAEDYTATTPDNASGSLTENVTMEFVNDKEGTVPTGVLLTLAPFAGIMALGTVGILVILGKKKTSEK